jgi:D-alanyl-D-alanine carboxypeptidase
MPAQTLLEWDRTLINKSLLNAASYQQMETAFTAKDGKDTGYGLGMKVRVINRHLRLEHGGEVGGYVAENIVYPDDGVAFVILTNQVASGAAAQIGARLTALLLPEAAPADAAPDSLADALPGILARFARGQIDRSLFTDSCNAYFSGDALQDFKSTLEPLGPVISVYRTATGQRGGMTFGSYRVVFTNGTTLVMDSYTQTEGKIDQLLITARE